MEEEPSTLKEYPKFIKHKLKPDRVLTMDIIEVPAAAFE